MSKKQFFFDVCLILGSLLLADSVLAKPDHNKLKNPKGSKMQSAKKCPRSVIAGANVKLTKAFPNFQFSDNATPLDPNDDFYQICSGRFGCQAAIAYPSGVGLTIIGSNGPNVIQGTLGNDVICGMNGDDTINGGNGNDVIYGNNGSDDLFGGLGNDLIHGGNGNDTLLGADENLDMVLDADLAITLGVLFPFTTPVDSDTLYGGNGNDQLFGGPDADFLWGENGRDFLDGGDGIETIDGGRGKDTCTDLNDACASGKNI